MLTIHAFIVFHLLIVQLAVLIIFCYTTLLRNATYNFI